MVLIAKQFKFEAAHVLPNHKGQCARLHGHSYVVEVAVTGEVEINDKVPEHGMVADFDDLKGIWLDRCEPYLDHQFLNETLPVPVTTAEWIALWIHGQFAEMVELVRDDTGIDLAHVKVWETASSYAQVSAPRVDLTGFKAAMKLSQKPS